MATVEQGPGMEPVSQSEESAPYEKPSSCLFFGQEGLALLYGHWMCDHCKNVVQAEALAKRRKIGQEGGGPSS